MPRARRKQKSAYHHGDLRRAVLDAAIDIVAKKGPDALTLRNVAQRIGVTAPALYHHFADKDAIIIALASEGFAKLTDQMNAACRAAPDTPLHRLRALGSAYIEFALGHRQHYKLMFGAVAVTSRMPLHDCGSLPQEASNSLTMLQVAVHDAQQAGQIGPHGVDDQALVCWAVVHGLSLLWIDSVVPLPDAESVSAIAAYAADVIIAGLAVTK